ncbi:hypothetical protein K458DRAFT_393096 [Lentithecium fluviatile CBS 122367]|uniref:Uncharacterized protein n=1 Tax=Lentithecium fluviatile CBS 122367 TaxID=1168545 RepID=A0A6G1IPH6_9PLEO|nr:hypothetical protein K458DRAFT_393096 [Lentithecium fluviatile CBS 122367]
MAVLTLPQLPTDVISEIAPYLVDDSAGTYCSNLYGLYGLRLTCRALYFKTLYNFTQAAFHTVFVDFSLESLDRFYAISQHEEFRKAVKRIYFSHDRLHPVSLGPVYNETVSLEENVEYIIKLGLNKILSRLPNLSGVVIITPFAAPFRSYYSIEEPSESPTPQTETKNEIRTPSSVIRVEMYTILANRLYQILLGAASSIRSRLESLELQAFPTHLHQESNLRGSFSVCVHLLKKQYKQLHHIRQLRLSLDVGEIPCGCSYLAQEIPEEVNSENALCRTLRNMPHLTLLRISFLSLAHPDLPRRTRIVGSLATLHFPHLRAFGLNNAPAEELHLIEILSRHKDQLRELLFCSVDLISGGNWRSIIEWMTNHKMHKLSELTIEYLKDEGGILRVPDGNSWSYCFLFQGPHITERLQQTLSVMRLGN